MPWSDGDFLTPANLNTKTGTATSSNGYSTNTIRPESGNTISPLGMVDLRSGGLSIRTTASTASSSNLTNGEFCLVNVSNTSAQLAIRSGNTTYVFNAILATP